MRKDKFLLLTSYFLLLTSFFTSCSPRLDVPEPSAGDADFKSTIALGGDYLAGYQDGALYDKGQKNSIPSLLAARFQLVRGSDCNPPLMPDNSGLGVNYKPWESDFVTKSTLGYKTDCKGVNSLFPLSTTFKFNTASGLLNRVNSTVRNMAVPFATIKDFFNPSFGNAYGPGNSNPYYYRFASHPGTSTVFSDAIAYSPTFVIAWFGMEDIYEYARAGGEGKIILPPSDFANYMDSLLKPMVNKGAKGVLATIPYPSVFPFYALVPWNGLELTKTQADSLNSPPPGLFSFQEGKNGFVITDPTSPSGYRKMEEGEYILLSVPIDSMKCQKIGVISPLPDRYVLDHNEVKNINDAIAAYNDIIIQKSVEYDFAIAGPGYFLTRVTRGIKWDGVDFNADFVSGGFYSLDGYHPNQKGYALLANVFVEAINKKYKAQIPTVYCADCDGVLFP